MKRILLFGGGGCHDYKSICPVLQEYLAALPDSRVDYVAGDYDALIAARLAPYDLIVLYNTGGDISVEQKRGLVEGVAAGKAFVGVHAAADSFRNSPEYLAMVGGVFIGHPFIREYVVALTEPGHPVCRGLNGHTVKDWEKWPVFEYRVTDEQYLLDYDPRVKVLATAGYSGTLPRPYPNGIAWPVAWVKPWGKGRVFYLALGHNLDACREALFRTLFVNGCTWALERENG